MSIPFLLDKKPTVVPGGSAGERSGGARKVPYGAARSNSERAAPSACVGKRFSGPQIVWNRSTRRAGARGGARVGKPRWLRILMITGGSSMAAMIFKMPPQCGQCSMSISKTRLSSRAQLMRAGAPCARRDAEGSVACSAGRGNDFTTQLGVGREHAMEADQM